MTDTGSPKTAPHRPRPATAISVLSAAREMVAKEGGWTQKEFARTATGLPCVIISQSAFCFCAMGAIERAAIGARWAVRDEAADLFRAEGIGNLAESISLWNDAPHRTQAAVVAAFDAAINRVAGVDAERGTGAGPEGTSTP